MQIPSFLLQSNELAQDAWWVAGAAIVLVIAYFLTHSYQKKQKTREDLPPKTKIVNDSNYNIGNTGVEDKNLSSLPASEADEVIDKMKKTDYIPTDEEFHELRKAKKAKELLKDHYRSSVALTNPIFAAPHEAIG